MRKIIDLYIAEAPASRVPARGDPTSPTTPESDQNVKKPENLASLEETAAPWPIAADRRGHA